MKKCNECNYMNNDAADICLNCQANLTPTKIHTPYSDYQENEHNATKKEMQINKWNILWTVIDVAITIIFIICFLKR